MIKVVNVKDNLEGQYIGRAKKGLYHGSPLGSPFVIGRDGTRAQCIAKYRVWLWREIKKKGPVYYELQRLLQLLNETGSLTLVCWCKPYPCHGDIITSCLKWMNESKV